MKHLIKYIHFESVISDKLVPESINDILQSLSDQGYVVSTTTYNRLGILGICVEIHLRKKMTSDLNDRTYQFKEKFYYEEIKDEVEHLISYMNDIGYHIFKITFSNMKGGGHTIFTKISDMDGQDINGDFKIEFEKNTVLEDATCNAGVAGMGSVVSAQPGSLPGTTGTTGSGDIGFTFKLGKKRKKGNPSQVSDLRDLEPAKTNKIIESLSEFTIRTELQSINDFGRYLDGMKDISMQSIKQYYKNRVKTIYGLPGDSTLFISNKKLSKYMNDYKNMISLNQVPKEKIEEKIEELYVISKSDRHNTDVIDTIKDILMEMEDYNIIKVLGVSRSYDLNIKKEDKTLIPRFIVSIESKPKKEWNTDYSIDQHPKNHISSSPSPIYSLNDRFESYGLSISNVTSEKICLSQIG